MTKAIIVELKSAILIILDKLYSVTDRSVDGGDETIKYMMGTLMNLVKLLQYYHKHVAVSREHLNLFMCIASLPWIVDANSKYVKLVPCGNDWNASKLKQLACGIAKHMDYGVCLEVFIMCPSEFFTEWKVYVLKEIMVRNIIEIQELVDLVERH